MPNLQAWILFLRLVRSHARQDVLLGHELGKAFGLAECSVLVPFPGIVGSSTAGMACRCEMWAPEGAVSTPQGSTSPLTKQGMYNLQAWITGGS